jgi:hypothetical protein
MNLYALGSRYRQVAKLLHYIYVCVCIYNVSCLLVSCKDCDRVIILKPCHTDAMYTESVCMQ